MSEVSVGAQIAKTRSATRVDWADLAKGFSISLVVLLHTVNFMVVRGLADAWWYSVNAAVEPIRMPLFFLVAGLFASGGVALSWKSFWRRRIAPLLYLYLLWMFVRFAVFSMFPQISGTQETSTALNLLTGFVVPSSGLWFLFALMVYATVARACRNIDPRVQVAGAVLVGALGPLLMVDLSWTWTKIFSYGLFFMMGLHLSGLVSGIAEATTTLWAILWPVGFAAIYFASTVTGPIGVPLLVSIVGVITGVVLCARFQHRLIAVPLRRLGALTLPIYLLHEIVLGTAITGATALDIDVRLGGAGPVVVTLVAITISVVISRTIGNRVSLFQLPRTWRAS